MSLSASTHAAASGSIAVLVASESSNATTTGVSLMYSMKEIKRKHREELEEVTYQQGKKMEMKKEEMTDKINFLEGEIRKLMFEIKCLNQSNEYGSTSTDEMKDEEPEDIYKINE